MDKNAIKKLAIWARRELIERVSQRAAIYGITAEDHGDPEAESINGRLLSSNEKNQRKILISSIEEKGFEQVIEEVAYTWFNRFAALRFMEVNGYLPSHVRVFTNDAGEFKPQILTEAIHLELDGLNMDKVYELENANKTEELFKYLLIVQCNALNSILPGMFQRIDDYTELLLPDNLLREGSVIEKLVVQGTSDSIPESDWTDQVQIIGWLYQYYNTEQKDKVFADLKKNIKITKEKIPAATQLFTPDWIVHYMVENSLGRLWLEGHPNNSLKSEWKYYLDEAEQEESVKVELEKIRKEYAKLKPEEIKVIDPCSGSGHILCVIFDVLVRIYEDFGYTAREAVTSIVENNLYGLDIDERAAQLSYFAVMMKARQYDRRFFSKKDVEGNLRIPQPHVYAIEESNGISSEALNELGQHLTQDERNEAIKQVNILINEMHDAKEYGSLTNVIEHDWELLRRFVELKTDDGQMTLNLHGEVETSEKLQQLISIGEPLSQKYDVVVTNPPYMGCSGMSGKLASWVKDNYPDSKSDLFAIFIERIKKMIPPYGYQSMITQHAWMFLSSYEKLRQKLLSVDTCNMIHLGARAFEEIGGEVVQTTSFVFRNSHIQDYQGEYVRLVAPTTQQGKEDMFLRGDNRFVARQDNFSKIPGSPIAYWVHLKTLEAFSHKKLIDYAIPKQGLATGDNDRFLRFWYEVSFPKIDFKCSTVDESVECKKKWFPCNKGGAFRRWYGNREYIVNWENNGYEIRNNFDSNGKQRSRPQNVEYYFKEGMTWSTLSNSKLSMRYSPAGSMFETKGSVCFPKNIDNLKYLLGFMNTKVAMEMLQFLSPTIDYHEGPIGRVPIIFSVQNEPKITKLVTELIQACTEDWNNFETSWDFNHHPFITGAKSINDVFQLWEGNCEHRFNLLKEKEENLNKIFIDIYSLQTELSPEVEDNDITVRKADLSRDIRSFISYAVGCMFGRYSLDVPGLVYAGGTWDPSKYTSFPADEDAILPICDDEYFEDDIVGLFINFVEKVYGKETLEENLQFIADALGGKGTSRKIIRNYFINGFYADHVKVYQKRPIYWLFDSGKKNGFKCLIYLHRYKPDTIARIRTDYIHEQQSRYRTAIEDLNQRINGTTASDKVKLGKKLTQVQEQAEELRIYEEKIHHLADQMIEIDLDDGVKVNYAKFEDVLAKIK